MGAAVDRGRIGVALADRSHAVAAAAGHGDETVAACRAVAERFLRGGKLVAFGSGALAADAQHVAVEFVHPVIVGKRALPAVSLAADVATLTAVAAENGYDEIFAAQVPLVVDDADTALGLTTGGDGAAVAAGLAAARRQGALTVAIAGGDAIATDAVDHLLPVAASDPRIVKEVMVTYYHLLWELVHVYLERTAPLGSGARR